MLKYKSLSSNRYHYANDVSAGLSVCGVRINVWSWTNDAKITCKKCLRLTKLALDGGDSAASEQLSTPEVLSTLQGESTPAHRK